jgi:hypothetical protein
MKLNQLFMATALVASTAFTTVGCAQTADPADDMDEDAEVSETDSVAEALTVSTVRVLPKGARIARIAAQPRTKLSTANKIVAWEMYPYRWGNQERGVVLVGVDSARRALTAFAPSMITIATRYDTQWADGATGALITGAGGRYANRGYGKFLLPTAEGSALAGLDAKAAKAALPLATVTDQASNVSANYLILSGAAWVVASILQFIPQTAAVANLAKVLNLVSANSALASGIAYKFSLNSVAYTAPAPEVNGFYMFTGMNFGVLYPSPTATSFLAPNNTLVSYCVGGAIPFGGGC